MLDKNGKSHFYNERDDEDRIVVAGIQLRNKSIKEEIIVKKFPVTIIIFDVLKINGEFMINKPYSERYNKLLKIQENERVKVAKNYNFKELWDKVLLEDLEGVVLKNPYSVYAIGKRDKNYVKIKNYKMGFVKVVKTESNNKGIKVYGYLINDERIEVEVQIQNAESIDIGSEIKIKWLDKVGNKLIQSTRA
jgi:ATP-dependent DNA ligase